MLKDVLLNDLGHVWMEETVFLLGGNFEIFHVRYDCIHLHIYIYIY